MLRDVVLTKRCGNAPKKLAILKQLQTHFNAKLQKGVGKPFPRVPPHYTPGYACIRINKHALFQSSEFISVCNSLRILLLNTVNVFLHCSD